MPFIDFEKAPADWNLQDEFVVKKDDGARPSQHGSNEFLHPNVNE